MIFFRKMGIVATMIFCSHNILGQTTTSAYYEYDAVTTKENLTKVRR